MNILEIRDLPTCFKVEGIGIHTEGNGHHESLLRAWNILHKVKELLELGTPQSVIMEMIAVMESVQYPDVNDLVVRVDSSEEWTKVLLAKIWNAKEAAQPIESESTK